MMKVKQISIRKDIQLSIILMMLFSLSACSVKIENTYDLGIIESLQTDKARYELGDPVNIEIIYEVDKNLSSEASLKIEVTHLENLVYEDMQKLQDGSSSILFTWAPPLIDYTGYLVRVILIDQNKTIDQKTIGVDVSSTWEVFPRYGYLADFSLTTERENEETIDRLNRYHLTGFLFYDWQYRHDQPVSLSAGKLDESWLNIANNRVYSSKVFSYITSLHDRNMKAANYNLVYGVYADFATKNKEMALYKDNDQITQDKHDLPNSWASDLYLVNPSSVLWQDHYLQMENEVLENFDFDIMHLDTLGNRGILYDSSGKPMKMETAMAQFTVNLKSKLNQGILFNFVSEYAKTEISKTKSIDFAYTEVWPDRYPTYSSLKGIIDKDLKNGYASVLASYMNYPKKTGTFNTAAVLYTESVILASGGAHLSMGDLGMLSSEYFPNNKLNMTEDLTKKMIEYGDFMVAYENLLRGNLVEDNSGLSLDDLKFNTIPAAKSIWLFSKENEQYKVVHLLNFLNKKDTLWRDDFDNTIAPTIQENIGVNIPIDTDLIEGVYLASPDTNGGSSQKLEFKTVKDGITVKVPTLSYWSMIYIVKK
jgi:dextranase